MTIIDIFSGFLGAGKTTLIKKMIQEAYKNQKLVLIENEFGEIGIDGGFLQDAGINITEMNSGCICCSLVGDFGKALTQVISEYHPDRVIIEPSGVGKLSDVIAAVEKVTGDDVVLGYTVAVADAGKVKVYMKNFGEFYNNQIETANTIILSRTDSVSQAKLDASIALIREHNEQATLITTPWNQLSGEQLITAMEGQATLAAEMAKLEQEHHHHHEHGEHCGCGHHHHDHDEHCGCGHHHHDHDEHCGCGHHHHDHDEHCSCGHHHEEHHCEHGHHHGDEGCHEHHHGHVPEHCGHEHHHDHEEHCCCGHHHEEHHHHEHGEHCGCGHHHEEHHHHEHGEHCSCGHHHEEHHHHEHGEHCSCGHDHHNHHADEVFTSWGRETHLKFERAAIEAALKELDSGKYGMVLRAKGILPCVDGTWIHFDMVPEEIDIREGGADIHGKLCVIGSKLDEDGVAKLFGV